MTNPKSKQQFINDIVKNFEEATGEEVVQVTVSYREKDN